jgi:hypothetical protein
MFRFQHMAATNWLVSKRSQHMQSAKQPKQGTRSLLCTCIVLRRRRGRQSGDKAFES